MSSNIQLATVGGGCFWCTEAIFHEVRGVENVVSGYSGGLAPGHPTYREVCSGLTGHAEVVQITFDSNVISFEDILIIFMTTHDPTTLNRQGADKGTQYRSVIFYHDEIQKGIADKVIDDLSGLYDNPIVTEVKPLERFYEAEGYHQEYYNNNPSQGYCNYVITPKLAKFRKMHHSKLKP
ncbi:peptide-methionine (S)-S-oxide reductase MsrA [Aestuariivivens sediminicola]|uniref:peptide-methionine (S)-S-oxide reductase MsrA n=1 Tax=Aestuariivivens sediminicola TaxID=2913560 RepID=UPI001F5A14A5|nr:peptide-methionine (S)-S-oxide reductase MsrA [Aestuariivivens sediminicola]